ncbi:YicC/YloC family endoribonuclease [Marinigracilibium pacificum]|uniref:YicC family protein n=1 Tax=Marinigracilibium pacificum TaxID=2729599 RepID=A0A848J2W1_9BACT|nr:YicC/YloC family endoribonuclease [Marinigracilibium pacificum]NMM48669.1 YicC family protein [Marinigracilibium pacificum]
MIKSMTGYGMTRHEDEHCLVMVEVKSLNSKYLDTQIKLPKEFTAKEIEVKSLISKILQRGKVTISIDFQVKDDSLARIKYNKLLFKHYYHELSELKNAVNHVSDADIFRLAVQSPDVMEDFLDEEEIAQFWPIIEQTIQEALNKTDAFRQKEGKILSDQIHNEIDNIGNYLEKVKERDPARVEMIRERIEKNIKEYIDKDKVDENRFEQELIYYIEKLDINEEKVRLKAHLDYFTEVLDYDDSSGKKLNFIGQEIGREINTIGSKANDAMIQKYVVNMKESLEQIKEQILNIL